METQSTHDVGNQPKRESGRGGHRSPRTGQVGERWQPGRSAGWSDTKLGGHGQTAVQADRTSRAGRREEAGGAAAPDTSSSMFPQQGNETRMNDSAEGPGVTGAGDHLIEVRRCTAVMEIPCSDRCLASDALSDGYVRGAGQGATCAPIAEEQKKHD